MALTNDDVLYIAKLANLQLGDSQVDQYKRELTRILDFVEQMNSVNVDHVEPMAHPQEMMQPVQMSSRNLINALNFKRSPRRLRTGCTWCLK